MKNNYITVGYIIATHGLRGGLKIKPATSFIDERFKINKKLFVINPKTKDVTTLTIQSIHENKGMLVLTFKELLAIEEAEAFVKLPLLIERETTKLKKGFIYLDDLLDMTVILEDNTHVGIVSEVLEYASYHTLRVKRSEGTDVLIPYISEFIVSADLASKTSVFRPIEGMLWKLQFSRFSPKCSPTF